MILTVMYCIKLVRYADAVKAEFWNPVTLGFCGAWPVGMSLVAGGIAPYLPAAGQGVWGGGFSPLVAFPIFSLYPWLFRGIQAPPPQARRVLVVGGGGVVPRP